MPMAFHFLKKNLPGCTRFSKNKTGWVREHGKAAGLWLATHVFFVHLLVKLLPCVKIFY